VKFHRELRAEDIEIFSEAIGRYFKATTGKAAAVRSAYLLTADAPARLYNDFNGLIEISGGYAGSVCFSAPLSLLTHVLLASGEQDYTDEKHADLVGEIANTMAGQARRHFGEHLEISVPQTFRRREAMPGRRAQSTPYAIPLTWNGYGADLVVNLDVVRRV
jgi:chemotaxis protein CheX